MKHNLHLWLDQNQNDNMRLYYLLDSAADEQFPDQLEQLKSSEAITSLFVGTPQEALNDVAPYLIMLDRNSALFELLSNDGKNKNWGIFILSEKPFYELVKHYQSQLSAKLPSGESVYFRFYDPRILNIFCQSSDKQAICDLKGGDNLLFAEIQEPNGSLSVMADGHCITETE